MLKFPYTVVVMHTATSPFGVAISGHGITAGHSWVWPVWVCVVVSVTVSCGDWTVTVIVCVAPSDGEAGTVMALPAGAWLMWIVCVCCTVCEITVTGSLDVYGVAEAYPHVAESMHWYAP
jgi:hypothetical protein